MFCYLPYTLSQHLKASTSQTEAFRSESITITAQNKTLIPANLLLLVHRHKLVWDHTINFYCPLFQPLLTRPEEKKIPLLHRGNKWALISYLKEVNYYWFWLRAFESHWLNTASNKVIISFNWVFLCHMVGRQFRRPSCG